MRQREFDYDDILRRALRTAADGIEPSGDGLERIRARLTTPRPLAAAWLMAGYTDVALPALARAVVRPEQPAPLAPSRQRPALPDARRLPSPGAGPRPPLRLAATGCGGLRHRHRGGRRIRAQPATGGHLQLWRREPAARQRWHAPPRRLGQLQCGQPVPWPVQDLRRRGRNPAPVAVSVGHLYAEPEATRHRLPSRADADAEPDADTHAVGDAIAHRHRSATPTATGTPTPTPTSTGAPATTDASPVRP